MQQPNEGALLRLDQIIGNTKKGIPPIIPVGKSSWWRGVADGRFPKPVRFGKRVTCWRASDVYALVNKAG
jgi:prophage regulatory protein